MQTHLGSPPRPAGRRGPSASLLAACLSEVGCVGSDDSARNTLLSLIRLKAPLPQQFAFRHSVRATMAATEEAAEVYDELDAAEQGLTAAAGQSSSPHPVHLPLHVTATASTIRQQWPVDLSLGAPVRSVRSAAAHMGGPLRPPHARRSTHCVGLFPPTSDAQPATPVEDVAHRRATLCLIMGFGECPNPLPHCAPNIPSRALCTIPQRVHPHLLFSCVTEPASRAVPGY